MSCVLVFKANIDIQDNIYVWEYNTNTLLDIYIYKIINETLKNTRKQAVISKTRYIVEAERTPNIIIILIVIVLLRQYNKWIVFRLVTFINGWMSINVRD